MITLLGLHVLPKGMIQIFPGVSGVWNLGNFILHRPAWLHVSVHSHSGVREYQEAPMRINQVSYGSLPAFTVSKQSCLFLLFRAYYPCKYGVLLVLGHRVQATLVAAETHSSAGASLCPLARVSFLGDQGLQPYRAQSCMGGKHRLPRWVIGDDDK